MSDLSPKGKLQSLVHSMLVIKEIHNRVSLITYMEILKASTMMSIISLWSEGYQAIRCLEMFLQQNKLKIWLYWFQSKRISMPKTVSTKHVISCSGVVWDGLQSNRWITFNDLLKENIYSKELRATRKILKDQEQSGGKLASQPILRMHYESSWYCYLC